MSVSLLKRESYWDDTLRVCTECVMAYANGERPEEVHPEPLCLVAGDQLALSMDEDTEPHFSWSQCQGCGCWLGGDRYPLSVRYAR